MLTALQILAFAEGKWPQLLRAEATGEPAFPLYVRFGRPPTSGDFDQIRRATAALASEAKGWRIEWEEVRTRKWGQQRWPTRVVFDSIEEVALALGRTAELKQIRRSLREARQTLPALEPWLRVNAHRLAEHVAHWGDLLAVCSYFDANPRPKCYPRQIPAMPDTKFIERHEAILNELLGVTLGERVNRSAESFAERFHLRYDPPQVRFRFLDDHLRMCIGWPVEDCSVPVPAFASQTWRIPRVLIVENRTVFLCAPQVRDCMAIWGAGKAAALLESCEWLRDADVVYWGDCDEAGYGILSALRKCFPHVRSLLMDASTWALWSQFAVRGRRDPSAKHAYLTASEQVALDAVVAGPWMLEQERIPPCEANAAIAATFLRSYHDMEPDAQYDRLSRRKDHRLNSGDRWGPLGTVGP